jgi:hypothetical protein
MNESLWLAMREIGAQLMQALRGYLPNLAGALTLLLLGWGVAYIAGAFIRRLVTISLNGLARSQPVARVLDRSDLRRQLPGWTGATVFWMILLFSIAAAMERLQLAVFTTLLSGVASLLPRVLLGILIVIAGIVSGNLAYSAVASTASSAGIRDASFLGRFAQMLLLFMGFVIGAEQVGIETTLLTVLVTTVVAVGLAGGALAFGLGSGVAASNMIAAHYLLRTYQPGQRVRIGYLEGRILEITQTSVMLQGEAGRILIPARKFSEEASILLSGEN